MPYCGNCGNQLSDLAAACPKCGVPTARGFTASSAPVLARDYRSAPSLRPLGVGEVIDAAIKIYMRNAGPLLTLVALVVIPVQIVNALILASATPPSLSRLFGTGGTTLQQTPTFDFTDFRRFLVATLLTVMLGFLASQLATAASLRTVSEAYLGERPDWRESLRFAVSKLGRLIGYSALLFAFVGAFGIAAAVLIALVAIATRGLGLILLLPAIFVAIAWAIVSLSVGIPVLLLENVGIVESMRRSFQLIRHRWWPTFGVLFLSQLIAGAVRFVFVALFTLVIRFGSNTLVGVFTKNVIIGSIVGVLTTPFLAAVIAILYFDLRVRREGFDLELLAQHVGRPELAPTVQSSPLPAPPAPRRAPPRRPGFVSEPDGSPEEDVPPPPRKVAPRKAPPRRPVADEPETVEDEPPAPARKAAPRKPSARKPSKPKPTPPKPTPPKRAPRKPKPPPPPDDDGEEPEFFHG